MARRLIDFATSRDVSGMTSEQNITNTERPSVAADRAQQQPHDDACGRELTELLLDGKRAASEALRDRGDAPNVPLVRVICVNDAGVKQWDAFEVVDEQSGAVVQVSADAAPDLAAGLLADMRARACVLISARETSLGTDHGRMLYHPAGAEVICVLAVDGSGASVEARAAVDPDQPDGHGNWSESSVPDPGALRALQRALHEDSEPAEPARPVIVAPTFRLVGASEDGHICVCEQMTVLHSAIDQQLIGLAPDGKITPYLTFAGEDGCWVADLEIPRDPPERDEYCRFIASELCARRARAAGIAFTAESADGEALIYILTTDDGGCEELWRAQILRGDSNPPQVGEYQWIEAIGGTCMFMLHLGVKNIEAMVSLAERDGIPTAFKLPT
jgi:hypothetical protein